ncbi:hypothetical protein BZA77DRAFT_178120 [Pyronema omphalodes]|nr:hypothetical protein BZA77DRAFT_178120 [Pyronema omphalodes]
MKPPLLLRRWKEKLSLHHDCWAACAVVLLPHTLPSSIHPRVPPSSSSTFSLPPSLHLPPSTTPHHTSSRRRQTPILFIRSDLWKIQTINFQFFVAVASSPPFKHTHTYSYIHARRHATVLSPPQYSTPPYADTRTGVALLARTKKRNELVESAGPVVERRE